MVIDSVAQRPRSAVAHPGEEISGSNTLRTRALGPRMVHQAMLLGVLVAVAGCGQATFACMTDSECVSDGFEGMCQPSGYCSFGDPQCESGQRYGSHAPSSLASECVESAGTLTASSEWAE